MKVSNIKALLTEIDILNIIHEYVEVEGLFINSIKLGDMIEIEGSYKKGVDITFKALIGIGKVCNNTLNAKVFEVKLAKFGVFSPFKNFALKKALSGFEDDGIFVDKDTITLDIAKISKLIPYVFFKLRLVDARDGQLEVEIEDLIYAPEKEKKEITRVNERTRKEMVPLDDTYAKVRKGINRKVPTKYNAVVEYALIIPDIVALLWRLMRDKRVDGKVKLLVGGIVGYLAMPIDIMPDFIPFVGKIDDVAIAFFGLQKILSSVPRDIILQNWQGEENIYDKVSEGVKYIYKLAGSNNIAKVSEFINRLTKKERTQGEKEKHEERNHIY